MKSIKTDNVFFYIPGNKIPASLGIPTTDEISVFKNGKFEKRVIQYCIGEKSIYKDEQSEIAKPSKTIFIKNGVKAISPYESTLLTFLRTCDWNGSNPNRNPNKDILFMEHNAEEKAQKTLSQEREELEARTKVFQMDLEEVKAMASSIGLGKTESMSEDELRHSILMYSKSKPEEFIKKINDIPLMKRTYHINTALSYKLIERRGQSLFFKNGDLILVAPPGQDVVEYFVEKSYSDLKLQYDSVLKALFPTKDIDGGLEQKSESDESIIAKVVINAMDTGVISWDRKAMNFAITFKDEVLHLGKKTSTIEKSVSENQELLDYLKSLL